MEFPIDALRAVLDYLWEDEKDYRDYEVEMIRTPPITSIWRFRS